MRRHTLILLATVWLSALAGCATVSTITSEPPGAKVYMRGQYLGRTPVVVRLNDGLLDDSNHYVIVKKDGFKTQQFPLQKRWSAGYIALDALICGPTLGLGCYLAALNAKVHEKQYPVLLEPIERAPEKSETASR